MAETIAFDLVTPDGEVSSEPIEMVVIPGKDGDFGVLKGHSSLISALRPGVLRVFEGDKIVRRILVTSGVAEVTPERCAVLAHEVFDMADTSLEKIKARQEAAKEAHQEAADEAERQARQNDVDMAQAIVDAFIREQDAK